jgi:phosphate acetyltransferase
MSEYIENKVFSEIKKGDSASLTHSCTMNDITLFAAMSGDMNPAHSDPAFAKKDIFHKIIAQGMWGEMFFATILGTELPGPGTIYLDQTLKFGHPMSPGDTLTITVTVVSIDKNPEKHIIELDCKCLNQMETVVISGIATVIAPTEKVKLKRPTLPAMETMALEGSWYNQLINLKKDFRPLKTAVVHPVDTLSLLGAIDSAQANLIIPVLVGPKSRIVAAAKEGKLDISPYEIIDTQHSHESAEKSVALAKNRKVEALMKGAIHTDELMEAVLDKMKGIRTNRRVSHVFSLHCHHYPKPLFITDAAINISPTLEEKKDIVQNAIDLFVGLGLGVPNVAIVSAVETIREKMPSTLDAASLCKMADRGQIQGGILDGPLGFDLAISPESAKVKGIHSIVAGHADIIIVPDIESGNMLYKQMTFLSETEAAAIVLGASVPIILTSRGSDALSRKASCAMALVYTRNKT